MVLYFKGEGIEFIDRGLRDDEETHYKCKKCNLYLHQDLAYSHKCNPLVLFFKEHFKEEANKLEKICSESSNKI